MSGTIFHVAFPNMGIEFTVNRVAIQVGSFCIYWYGILIGCGFLLALLFAVKSLKRYKIDGDGFFNCVLAGLIAGIVGARAFFVLFKWDYYAAHPEEIMAIHNGGLAIYGGIIGALTAGCIVARFCHVQIPALLDIVGMGFLIGQGIGRWGNFVNQEAFGTATDLPWGMTSENVAAEMGEGVLVHPCFLYESLWCLLGFGVLYLLSRKWYRFPGQMFLLYMIWYGTERMFVEGLRTDSLYTPLFGLRVSQVISAVIVLVGAVLLVLGLKKAGRGKPAAAEGLSAGTPEEAETTGEEEAAVPKKPEEASSEKEEPSGPEESEAG